MANNNDIIQVVDTLMNAFPHYKPRGIDNLIDLWVRKFADTEAATLFKAVDMHLDRSKFFPAIHEITELLDQAWYEVQDDKDTNAWMAQSQETQKFWLDMMTADGRMVTSPGHWSKSDPDRVTLLEA